MSSFRLSARIEVSMVIAIRNRFTRPLDGGVDAARGRSAPTD